MTSNKFKMLAVAASIAFLSGCASNGRPMTGSQAGDMSTLGGIAGIVAGYTSAQALGADATGARNAALIAGIAGATMGYQHGKVLDERAAAQANYYAQQQQAMIQRDLQMQAQIRYAQMAVQPAPTPQVPQPKPVMANVAQGLELPIARYEMVSAQGGLTTKAVQSLGYMNRQAQQSNADLVILVPSADVGLASSIAGAAPGARLMESREVKSFVLIIQPRAKA